MSETKLIGMSESQETPFRPRLRERWEKSSTSIVIVTLLFVLILLYFYPTMLIFIHPGEAGVLWERFGDGTITGWNQPFVSEIDATASGDPIEPQSGQRYPYSEGFHPIFPWDKMYIYNIRLQQKHQEFDILSKDGLKIKAGVTFRWKLVESDVGKLHKLVGPDYVETLLVPTVGSYTRARFAEAFPGGIYSRDRIDLQELILEDVKADLRSRFFPEARRESMVIVQDVLIQEIELPELVQESIEEKRRERHRAEAHVYRLLRERIEASRKRVEAEGIESFQTSISGGIDEKYLRWRGIDATLDLATSDNAKIVIIGSSKDGLPLILGGLDQNNGTENNGTENNGSNGTEPPPP